MWGIIISICIGRQGYNYLLLTNVTQCAYSGQKIDYVSTDCDSFAFICLPNGVCRTCGWWAVCDGRGKCSCSGKRISFH